MRGISSFGERSATAPSGTGGTARVRQGAWPLLLAAVLSTLLSAYLLRDLRERFAQQVSARADRMSTRFEEMRAREDTD